MSDIVERLRANTHKYPGFQNLNTEAAAEIDRLRARVAELKAAESCLLRHGFTRCDAPACNCGSWHQTSGLAARFEELKDDLEAAGHPLCNKNGHVFRTAVAELVADRDRWKAEAMAARARLTRQGFAYVTIGPESLGSPNHDKYAAARAVNGEVR